jgi:hypothetical protein
LPGFLTKARGGFVFGAYNKTNILRFSFRGKFFRGKMEKMWRVESMQFGGAVRIGKTTMPN